MLVKLPPPCPISLSPGADPGGGGENLGIDFYSGFREKKHKGGGCNSKS